MSKKVVEYYNAKAMGLPYTEIKIGQKIKFDFDRTFEEVGTGKKIYIPAGQEGIATSGWTLLFGDDEVYLADDLHIINEVDGKGLRDYIVTVLEENGVFKNHGGGDIKLDIDYWIAYALQKLKM